MIFQNNNVYFYFYRFLQFCTHLTFDLVLLHRVIYRPGIHPYEFGHMSRNIMEVGDSRDIAGLKCRDFTSDESR